jgi:glycosyltransferase involved in cell wall biosynthesis
MRAATTNGWKVSFVIPTFNTAAFLPHAVKSCLNQSYKDIEIIVVNDASTDSTGIYLDWLKKQGDDRIIIHTNKTNKGRSESRNIGNKLASGRIICVLDADDLAVQNRAELSVLAMRDLKHDVVYGAAVFMDPLGNHIEDMPARPFDEKYIKEYKVYSIVHSTMAYTRDIALKYPYEGGEIADLGMDDWSLITRMRADGIKFKCLPDLLAAYRDVKGSISYTRDEKKVLSSCWHT